MSLHPHWHDITDATHENDPNSYKEVTALYYLSFISTCCGTFWFVWIYFSASFTKASIRIQQVVLRLIGGVLFTIWLICQGFQAWQFTYNRKAMLMIVLSYTSILLLIFMIALYRIN